jgi:myo-inositol-hexaphosphate 3-phosphohydrolase
MEALVKNKGLVAKKVESKGDKSSSFTVSNGHIIFAYPQEHGVLKSIIDPNGFETIGNYECYGIEITSDYNLTQLYYVYVSGATTVTNFKVTFKY